MLRHSPRFHNAGPKDQFRAAEMHFPRGASADFSCLRGNHVASTPLSARTIERRRPREPPGRRHGGKGSAVLETPPFDRDPTQESEMTTWMCLFATAATISSCLCVVAVAMNAEG